MRNPNGWTLYIVTNTGRKVPHWTDTTRSKVRAVKSGMLHTNTFGVKLIIEKN